MAGKVSDILKQTSKDYGSKIYSMGTECIDFERVPTGIYPMDVALGGGFPEGKMSMIFGMESSCKTTTALLMVAEYQRNHKDKYVIWVDVEWAFDRVWAAKLGVNLESLIVFKPETAEQTGEVAEGLSYADDTGLVVIDSIAAMMPQTEMAGDMDRMQVGGNAIVVQRMVRKINGGLMSSAKEERYPTFIFLNQLRTKISVMYGSPDKYPGGNALGHYCNIILRTYAKDVIDKSIHPLTPAWKDISFTVKKNKVPITSKSFSVKMLLLAAKDRAPGFISFQNLLIKHAKDFGYIVKDKSKWVFNDNAYKTLTEIETYIFENDKIRLELQKQLSEDILTSVVGEC